MSGTIIRHIEVRLGTDVYERCEPGSSLDVSDWDSHVLEGYLWENGVLIATVTQTASDHGLITKLSSGIFIVHWKRALLNGLSRGKKFRQVRRVDAAKNFALYEGTMDLKPYAT